MNKLRSREELAAFRKQCQEAYRYERMKLLVCCETCCVSAGSLNVFNRLQELLAEKNIPVTVELSDHPHDDVVGLKKSGCHGFCEMGPLIRIEPQGWLYTKVHVSDCEEIVEKSVIGG